MHYTLSGDAKSVPDSINALITPHLSRPIGHLTIGVPSSPIAGCDEVLWKEFICSKVQASRSDSRDSLSFQLSLAQDLKLESNGTCGLLTQKFDVGAFSWSLVKENLGSFKSPVPQ